MDSNLLEMRQENMPSQPMQLRFSYLLLKHKSISSFTSYDVGEWSECTKSCGVGRRTRTVLCRQQYAGNFTTAVSHKRCRDLVRPVTHEKCKIQDCARWEVEETWGKVLH